MRLPFIAATLAAAATAFGAAQAQNSLPDASPLDITQTTCRFLLRAGPEQEAILIFHHGFLSGQRNEVIVDVDAFRAISHEVVDACIEDPDAKLVDVFEAHR